MEKIISIDSVSDYNNLAGIETKHPLVSVINLEKSQPMKCQTRNFGFYAIFLKNNKQWNLRYGRENYKFEENTLIFFAPGQINGIENGKEWFQPGGNALLFHPDLIYGTHLGRHIQDYTFFSYGVNEGLRLSEKERKIVLACFSRIDEEISKNIDAHSKTLINSNIELLLNYCSRFYDRQFITQEKTHTDIIEKFEHLLNTYFHSYQLKEAGIPSVSYFSDKLHLSPNYFGDLIKHTTGKTPREYIQLKLIDISKERIFGTEQSISQIAYDLGFKYPQHFTRLFKRRTGMTPNEYRQSN